MSAANGEPLPAGTVLAGRYRIDGRPLGVGGMGSVYPATQIAVDRRVAVKVMHRRLAEHGSSIRRFVREARAVGLLDHRNVVRLHDFGEQPDGLMYLVMELVEGRSLDARLLGDPLPRTQAVEIADQVLAALSAAHEKGIVHRDLKPSNVLLTTHPEEGLLVKVVDFGLARMAEPEGAGALTPTGEVFGTPHYLSPEQARGERCDHRSDLYSVGVMLYEMLCGKRPFEGQSTLPILLAHMRTPPPPFSERAPGVSLPEPLVRVVFRALEKRREARFGSAREMREALAAAIRPAADDVALAPTIANLPRGSELLPAPPRPLEPPPARRPQRRAAAVLAAALIFAAGVALAFWLRPASTPPSAPPATAPRTARLSLTSHPTGARVEVRPVSPDTPPGTLLIFPHTPATLEVPEGTTLDIRFTRDGYAPQTLTHRALANVEVGVTLVAADQNAKPTPKGAAAPPDGGASADSSR